MKVFRRNSYSAHPSEGLLYLTSECLVMMRGGQRQIALRLLSSVALPVVLLLCLSNGSNLAVGAVHCSRSRVFVLTQVSPGPR